MILKINDELELHKIKMSDAPDVYHTIDTQRPYLGKWLPFVEFTRELKDTESFIQAELGIPEGKMEYIFTIRKNNQFIGLITIKGTDSLNQKTEIGYWLSEKEQGQGIMTMAVDKLCDFVFNELKLNRIQINCAEGNEPSFKIPERLGFTFEGIQREGNLLPGGVFVGSRVYSLLKSEYNK
ncbi:MAG: GNAT family N-acetyltransferase [Weeksellaceae bacterium]